MMVEQPRNESHSGSGSGDQYGSGAEKKKKKKIGSKEQGEEEGEEERGEVYSLSDEEKKLVRKMDLYIIPLVMLLYVFSFLDR